MQTNRNIALWASYDFANSLVSIVFFLYFAQWLVIDQHIPDLWFNLAFTASALLLLFTAPFTGTLLDKHLRRITGLRFSTLSMTLLFGICALCALNNLPLPALVFFTLGFYSYLLSFTFYTPLLQDIASEKRRGFVSGIGIAANYLGQMTGLIIVLPFSKGVWSLFQAAPRAETLLPAVLLFLLFSLPMLLFFQEPVKPKQKASFGTHFRDMIADTRYLSSIPSVFFFLLAYFLFNDAILTASNNFPIFLEQVWGVSDTVKTFILLGILITSAFGGLISGSLADRFGHKRTLRFILIGWLFILPLVGFLTNFTLFVIATTLMGFWFGSNWAVSRSVMSYLAPKGKSNLVFAYFGLAERASSLLGPIVWGVLVGSLISIGSMRYRIAILVITCFILFGLWALTKVRDDRA